jgi:hypothetical protein
MDDKITQLQEYVTRERQSIDCDYVITNTTFKRFLVGSKDDVQAAGKKLLDFLKWRTIEKPELITFDNPGVALEHSKGYAFMHKTDKLNRPVIYVEAKKYDKNNREFDDVKKLVICLIENALKHTLPHEEKVVVVIDLHEFSLFKTMDYEVVKMFIQILQANYDEILGVGVLVNSPFIFWACWKIIHPWLDPTTAAKIKFASPKELSDIIDIENQPDFIKNYQKSNIKKNETQPNEV